MLALASILPLFLLTNSAVAIPTPRQSGGEPISIADAMASLYNMYLQSQGVTSGTFYPRLGGERQIDFSGVGNEYRHFIQALKNATDSASTPEQLKELNDLSTNKTTACVTELSAIQNEAYTAYKKMGGTGNLTDDVFTEFASQMFGNYSLAIDACHNAQNAYDNAVSKLQGLDHGKGVQHSFGQIEAEILAMGPLITPDGSLIPGINMATSQPIPGATRGQFKAVTVPFYAMPSLNITLTDWQTAPDDQPPTLNWTSTIDGRISASSDESSSSSVRIFLSKASASQNSNMSFSLTTAAWVSISFQGMELIDVERGAWFDDFATATAVANPSSNDPSGAKYKAAFDESFGTAANPGPASTYNDKALVVYKPKAIFKYGSQEEFDKAQSAQGEPPSRPPSNTLPTPPILPVALPVTGLPGPVPETGT
ncbi:hypothetical protein B0H19DRAFT_1271567 [Mycena capillaripes]|nr:hypothetical protein B0H19DRAFT_1271567 [Mycena capillaripes]